MDRTKVNIQRASQSKAWTCNRLACIKEENPIQEAFKIVQNSRQIACLFLQLFKIELLPKSLTGFIRLFEYKIFSEKKHPKNA